MGSKAEYEANKARRKAERERDLAENAGRGRLDHDPEATTERCFELAERFIDSMETIAESLDRLSRRHFT